MLEEGAIVNHDPENYKKDWRLALMAKITEWMQENETDFIPIIQSWDKMTDSRIQPLASLIGADLKDLPHLYLIHGMSGKAIMYPTKLDDVNNFSPKLIMAWAHSEIIKVELDLNKQHQNYLDEAIKAGPQKVK